MTKRTSSAKPATKPSKPAKPLQATKPTKFATKRPPTPKEDVRPRQAKALEARPPATALIADDAAIAEALPVPARASARARALVLDERDPKKATAALQKFGATELQRLFQELFDGETRSTSLVFLRKAVAKGLHERAGGQPPAQPEAEPGKPQPRRRHVAAAGERDPRLPPVGTILERTYKGEALRVEVLEDGFAFKGATFPSLSALAKTFTKCSTNGYLWFGLAQRPERSAAVAEAQS